MNQNNVSRPRDVNCLREQDEEKEGDLFTYDLAYNFRVWNIKNRNKHFASRASHTIELVVRFILVTWEKKIMKERQTWDERESKT